MSIDDRQSLLDQLSRLTENLREGDDIGPAQQAVAEFARSFFNHVHAIGKDREAEDIRTEYGSLHVHLATSIGRRILTPLQAIKKQCDFLALRITDVME